MAKTGKVRKGSHKVANVRRSEKRRARYKANLRRRANAGDQKAERLLERNRN